MSIKKSKEAPKRTRLVEYGAHLKIEKMAEKEGWHQLNKSRYGTYDDAIAEITRLQMEIEANRLLLSRFGYKRARNRPKNLLALEISDLPDGFWKTALQSSLSRKPKGRPATISLKEMEKEIHATEAQKVLFSKEKRNITDKEIITHRVSLQNLPDHEKKKIIAKKCGQLKYYRSETGIPQKPKKR